MAQKHRILVTEKVSSSGVDYLRQEFDVVEKIGIKREELLKEIGNYDAILTRSGTAVDKQLLEAGKKLKVVARAGVGTDNIDLSEAVRRGVLVINAPGANVVSAAEHTMAMMLAAARRVPQANASLRAGEWTREKFLGRELRGKTVGIVGLGKVGSIVAQACHGLGMRVLTYDPYISHERAEKFRAELMDNLGEMLKQVDVLTVHTPLNDETRGMIGEKEIALAKKGVFIINCARGGIINESALLSALESGHVEGAAIDVFDGEPVKPGSTAAKLVSLPNVVTTPHIGANTVDAQDEVAYSVAVDTASALNGMPVHAVNMPFLVDASNLPWMSRVINAGEVLGAIQAQLATGRVKSLEVSVQGIDEPKAAVTAFVKGFLGHSMGGVNLVNAMVVARERGIEVVEITPPKNDDYTNLVSTKVKTQEGFESVVAASLFADRHLRIVSLGGHSFEVQPTERMIIVENDDVPGVIGRIGTLFGKNRLNIAEFHLGRDAPGGKAMSIINVDNDVPPGVLEELAKQEGIVSARVITLSSRHGRGK